MALGGRGEVLPEAALLVDEVIGGGVGRETVDAACGGEAAEERAKCAELFILTDERDGERGTAVGGEGRGDERDAVRAFADGVEVATDDASVASLREGACLRDGAKGFLGRYGAGEFDVEQWPFGVDANDVHRQPLEPHPRRV